MYIPKISIELFDNNFYNIVKTNNVNLQTNIIEFVQSNSTLVFNKITLKKLIVPINKFNNIEHNLQVLYKTIDLNIKNEFFKKVEKLGSKNNDVKFDFSIRQLEAKYSDHDTKSHKQLGEIFLNKISNGIQYIAINSRRGPAHWAVVNKKTFNKLYQHMTEMKLTFDKNNNLLINNTQLIVEDSINDDEILLGRKNKLDEVGIGVFLLTDDNDNLLINEQINPGNFNSAFVIYYGVEELGNNPEINYLKINTTNIAEQRYMKLKKINSFNE